MYIVRCSIYKFSIIGFIYLALLFPFDNKKYSQFEQEEEF